MVPRPADLAMPAAALAATAPAPDAPDAVPPASATTAETVTLWNGDVIRVAPTSEGWVHSVDSASESNRSGLRPGDIFVTYVPTRERIDGQGTLSGILEREIAAGTPALTFAVQRESEVLLVSLAPPT